MFREERKTVKKFELYVKMPEEKIETKSRDN